MFRHYRVIVREPVINILPSYTSMSNAAVGNTVYNNFTYFFMLLKYEHLKLFVILKLSYLQQNWLKSCCCYNSHEVRLCGGS